MKKGLIVILLLITSMFAAIIIPRQQPKDAEEVDTTGEEGVSAPSTTEEATTEETPPEETEKTLRGVSLSPRSFEGQDFADFFEKAQQAGGALTWAGDWWGLVDEEGAAHVVTKLAVQYELEPVVIATYFDQATGELARPMNETTRRQYIEGAVAYVEAYEPRYIGLGIEINSFKMKSLEGYEEFVAFFRELYPLLKEASPGTKVFTVFQLERMKGLHGGLFGGTNDESLSQWGLLDDFPDADALAFTTYPCLVFKDPSEMPEDYYGEIRSHTSKEVLITESGWFREGPEGWESDDEEQASFINALFDLTEGLEPPLLIWSFLYDPNAQIPFDTMGLLDADEAHTRAWEAWTGS
jgi:hypothetical protein